MANELGGATQSVPEVLSILPLRGTVLFPEAVLPLAAGREASVRLIEDAVRGDRVIGVFGQRDATVEDPQDMPCTTSRTVPSGCLSTLWMVATVPTRCRSLS